MQAFSASSSAAETPALPDPAPLGKYRLPPARTLWAFSQLFFRLLVGAERTDSAPEPFPAAGTQDQPQFVCVGSAV